MTALGRTRTAILRTIVIVFISQLFHRAYTNPSQLSKQPQASSLQHHNKQQYPRLMHVTHQFSQPDSLMFRPETENAPHSSGGGGGGGIIVSGLGDSNSYEEAGGNLMSDASDESATASESTAVDRCRELINLALVSFNDLPALNVRTMDEIDCNALRAQIAAAASRSLKQMQQQQRLQQQQQQLQQQQQQRRSNKAMQQASNSENDEPEQYSRTSGGQQFSPSSMPISQPVEHINVSMTAWTPKGSLLSQQMQQVLAQRHLRYQQEQSKLQRELYLATTSTVAPTTQATTFDSLFETTTQLPTTTMEPTTTTTAPTTTTTTPQPRIRIFPSKRGGKPGSQRNRKTTAKPKPSTTTTTTTSKPPATRAEYADGSELSTDYYEEYDDQGHTTTTTTTTARPQRGGGRRKPKRQRTTSTSPRPSTTTTTLSPGYQPRPDGRIIDYMADPNLPRELKGVDLTNYPFYISVPDKINFECKGRHDGYYTNIDLHCQIYHHCAVGNRYDFLCPNYTLFDQTTFTCRFINTVDCANSQKHFDRNNDLYVEKDEKGSGGSTSTTTTTTTSTTAPMLLQPPAANTSSQPPEPRIGLQLSPRARSEARVTALSLIQSSRGTAP